MIFGGHPSKAKFGADNRVRTDDLVLGKHSLYQLSYIRINLVDQRGIEPRPMPCKGIVLPLSLSARKLSNLKLLYQKLRLLCSLLGKTNLVLTTGFEPATGFLLRITKPVLSAIQPSQHKIGRNTRIRTLDLVVPNHALYQAELHSVKLVAGEGLEPP